MEINMRRDIKKGMKKAAIGIVAATMLTVMAAPVSVLPVSAATVTRGSYDFSNMVVRRVWFNTNDPVFLIDDYERVWLDNNVNVVVLFQPFFSSIASTTSFDETPSPNFQMDFIIIVSTPYSISLFSNAIFPFLFIVINRFYYNFYFFSSP